MGAGHGHGPSGHAGARHRWRLLIAFCLISTFFVVELVAALISGSLALLSDAGHMAADVVALGAALLATHVATRPDRSGRRTYGRYRAEIFASGLVVLLMLGVSAFVVIEALRRIGSDVELATGPMLIVGGLGLLVNLIALGLLRGGAGESLNVKGAYLEVMADTAGSVGVLVAAVLIMATGDPVWDTVVAVSIGAFIVVRAVILAKQVLAVLGQQAPEGIDVHAVASDLTTVPGVREVHDLHLWTLTSGMHVATAHLVSVEGADQQEVLTGAGELLRERYRIEHATLQVESVAGTGCHDLGW